MKKFFLLGFGVFLISPSFAQSVNPLSIGDKTDDSDGSAGTLTAEEFNQIPTTINEIVDIVEDIFNVNGNIGIGTEAPNAKLHVDGSIQVDGALRFRDTSAEGGNNINSNSYDGHKSLRIDGERNIDMIINSEAVYPFANFNIWKDSPPGDPDSGAGGTPLFRVDDSGNARALGTICDSNGCIGSGGGGSGGTSPWTEASGVVHYSGGNVGIGKSSPAAPLHIKPSGTGTDVLRMEQSLGSELWAMAVNGTGDLLLQDDSVTTKVTFKNSTGNVGIGTVAPTEKLEVAGNIKASGTICDSNGCIGDGDSGGSGDGGTPSPWTEASGVVHYSGGNVGIGTTNPGSKLEINVGVNSGVKVLSFYENESAFKRFFVRTDFATNENFLTFGKENEGVTDTDILTIASPDGGRVGIGTNNPQVKLEVVGSGGGGDSTDLSDARIRITSTQVDQLAPGIEMRNIENDGGDKYSKIIARDGDAFSFEYGNATSLEGKLVSIRLDGKVGIGTTQPNAELETVGKIRASHDSSEYTEIGHGGSNGYINTVGSGNLDFRHDGSNKMSLLSSGRLGIGTSSPSTKLDVEGNVSASNYCAGDGSKCRPSSAIGKIKESYITRIVDDCYCGGTYSDQCSKSNHIGSCKKHGGEQYLSLEVRCPSGYRAIGGSARAVGTDEYATEKIHNTKVTCGGASEGGSGAIHTECTAICIRTF